MTNEENRIILVALNRYVDYCKHKLHNTHDCSLWDNIMIAERTRDNFLKSIQITEETA